MTIVEKMTTEGYLSFEQAMELFDICDIIAVDTETTTSGHKNDDSDIRDGTGHCNGLSLASRLPGVGIVSTYLPFRHNFGGNLENDLLFELKKKIENYRGYLSFHNAKFDMFSMRTLGINYTGKFYCTLQLAHLINENLPYAKDLDSCGKFYLDDPGKLKSEAFKDFVKAFGWKAIPPELIFEYAAYDANLDYRLLEKLLSLMDDDLKAYWEEKQKFYKVIISMESRGVRVDTDLCKRMITQGDYIMQDITDILGLNPGSPKDLKNLLIDKMELPVVKKSKKTGAPSFDKYAMEEYELMLANSDDPTAEYILSYRGWQKSVSSNYKAYLELLSPDGRLRPNYKLHGTKTGRMSCEKPNLQQIPRKSNKPWNGEMKSAFIADEGYELWEADYGQLELRLATAYAAEDKLKLLFNQGRDVFTEMSEQLGMARHDTKTLTYTIQYGGGINRISTVFNVSPTQAEKYISNFYETYPGFRTMSNMAKRKAAAKGSLKLWSGRKRHFLYPAEESHKAFNSVIQGGAADIVERTMVRLDANGCNVNDCRMLLQVHDSVVFEIKKEKLDYYIPKIRDIMVNVEPDFGVKFAVDVHKWGS